MEAIRNTFKKELNKLEISETEEITTKSVEKKFKKKALKVHPDKTGTDDDAEFKELLADFRKLQTALKELKDEDENDINDEDDESSDLSKFFDKNNVATEKSKSWTIVIENVSLETFQNICVIFDRKKPLKTFVTRFQGPILKVFSLNL